MFQIGEGGAILLVKNKNSWRGAVQSPIPYEIEAPDYNGPQFSDN
jgi:hypothetical protein